MFSIHSVPPHGSVRSIATLAGLCLFGLGGVATASPGCAQISNIQTMLRPQSYTGSTDQPFNPGDDISVGGTIIAGSAHYAEFGMFVGNTQVLDVYVNTANPSQTGTYVVPTGHAGDAYHLAYNGYTGDPVQVVWNCTAINADVAAVVPASGAQASRVTVIGAAFEGASAVAFGNTSASSFTVLDDSHLVAVAPAGSGTVAISVTTDASTTPATLPAAFRYVDDVVFQNGFE